MSNASRLPGTASHFARAARVCSWLLLPALSLSCSPGEPPPRPNVLLVVMDTVRADFLSCYGFEQPTTPNIDRLAESGTRYERAYSTDHWTLSSHASMFTGLYPSAARATSETRHLPEGLTTLAERLAAAGYRTRAGAENPWISVEHGFGQGFEEFVETWRPTPERRPGPPALEPIRWIRDFAASGEPFFIFLNFNTAHLPYTPAPDHLRRFVGADRSADDIERLSAIRGMFAHFVGQRHHDAEDFEILRELYAAEIHMVDGWIGDILRELATHRLLDSTLVIITSDHGENIGDHGSMGHVIGTQETLLRVPLIIRYPERFPATTSEELTSLVDLAPTILDVTGVEDDTAARASIETRSLCGPRRRPREFVVAENDRPILPIQQLNLHFPTFDTSHLDYRVRVIRDARHKLVWTIGRDVKLYDLDRDPGETTDLAGQLPQVADDLRGRLEEWMASVETLNSPEIFETRDPQILEELRSLGYIK